MEIAVFAAISLLILGGIVTFAVGNRGWSLATVATAIALLLATGGFLYLAGRLAARDLAWVSRVRYLERALIAVRDGMGPSDDGGLQPLPGMKSLAALKQERDQWARLSESVETWRGQYWTEASYEPMDRDGQTITARIEIPGPKRQPEKAEAGVNELPQVTEPPLLAAGALLFLFDDRPLAEGGRYVGAFSVRESRFDAAIDRQVLTAALVGESSDGERQYLAEPHNNITVYNELPVDRWIAFFRTNPPTADGGTTAATPRNDVGAQFDGVGDGQVRKLVQEFVTRFEQHDKEVPEDEWPMALEQLKEGEVVPGILWATVEFTKNHTLPGEAGSLPREFAVGDKAEFDLRTAMEELRDRDGVVNVLRVVRRRPLTDALAAIYGTTVDDNGAIQGRVDGALALARQLRAEIDMMQTSKQRLNDSVLATTQTVTLVRSTIDELTQDLESWKRDAVAALGLADAFATSFDSTTREREQADQAIVTLGRELAATLARLTAEIDRVAPAPGR